jgi:hypothetical protein
MTTAISLRFFSERDRHDRGAPASTPDTIVKPLNALAVP